ncbi:MAG TPA: cytochrome c, partial [Acidimicrobiales bacterium]|nr:cytochrome c [Acidimicrobiales bacterium]
LYEESCAVCHGSDLRGTERGPSHLSEVYEPGHHNDESFRAAIAQGSPAHHWDFGDMPPVPGLDAAEVEAIIDYVRAQQEEQGLEPYPPS